MPSVCSHLELNQDEHIAKVVVEYYEGRVTAMSFITNKLQFLSLGNSPTNSKKDVFELTNEQPLIGFKGSTAASLVNTNKPFKF